jgi:hypothetical protein
MLVFFGSNRLLQEQAGCDLNAGHPYGICSLLTSWWPFGDCRFLTLVASHKSPFFGRQDLPFSREKFPQIQLTNSIPQQTQRGMTNRGGHATNLAILAFD